MARARSGTLLLAALPGAQGAAQVTARPPDAGMDVAGASGACTFLVFWPLLRHLPVPDYLAGAWVGSMEHTIPSYVGTGEECLFRADLDSLLPAFQNCSALLLYGQQDRTCR
jgi:hypothetical protein